MDQTVYAQNETTVMRKWLLQDSVEFEHEKMELMEEIQQDKLELEQQKRALEREKKEFLQQKLMREKQQKSEEQLFRMKWKVLETELSKLASEKLEVEAQKKLFYQDYAYEKEKPLETGVFFAGVSNLLALKKRHRDLIKIYHPDNVAGDTSVIQEINREYEKLQNEL